MARSKIREQIRNQKKELALQKKQLALQKKQEKKRSIDENKVANLLLQTNEKSQITAATEPSSSLAVEVNKTDFIEQLEQIESQKVEEVQKTNTAQTQSWGNWFGNLVPRLFLPSWWSSLFAPIPAEEKLTPEAATQKLYELVNGLDSNDKIQDGHIQTYAKLLNQNANIKQEIEGTTIELMVKNKKLHKFYKFNEESIEQIGQLSPELQASVAHLLSASMMMVENGAVTPSATSPVRTAKAEEISIK